MTQRYAVGDDWGASSDWNPAGLPVTDDECFFSEDSVSMTGTMSQGGIDLNLLYTHPEFVNNVGASAGPLEIAADLVVVKGQGGFYYACDKGTSPVLKTDEVRIACDQADARVELNSVSGNAGEFDKIVCLRGNIQLGAAILFGASAVVEVGYIANRAGDVNLVILENADTLANLEVRAGLVESNGPVTAAKIYSGRVTQDKAAMTTVNVYGGTLIYNHSALGSGGYIEVWPGAILDFMQTAEQKTLTIRRHLGSIVRPWDSSLHTITETWL